MEVSMDIQVTLRREIRTQRSRCFMITVIEIFLHYYFILLLVTPTYNEVVLSNEICVEDIPPHPLSTFLLPMNLPGFMYLRHSCCFF